MTLSQDWKPPSGCQTSACVVVRRGIMSDTVEISRQQPGLKDGITARVTYTSPEWREFVTAVKNGEYDI